MNKIWVTSDHHFFHENIIEYCDRPFKDEYEMNDYMVEKWNGVVGKDDLVIHVGDFFAGLKGRYREADNLVKGLNGRKVLLKGNHDHFSERRYKKIGFVYFDYFYIYDKFLFSHYPLVDNPKFPNEQISVMKQVFDENNCEKIFHGHQHGTQWPDYENHYNVAVDRNDFTPVDLLKKVNELGWK